MNLTDQNICVYLARKDTPTRAADIADAIDKELAEVSRALRDLVDMDCVHQERGEHPNGTMGPLYSLSETFKAGRDYQVVMAIAGASRPVTPPAPAPTPAPAPAAVLQQFIDREPAEAPLPEALVQELSKAGQAKVAGTQAKPLNRAERAVAFITEKGSATDADIRELLSMDKYEYPSSVLTHAARRSRCAQG